MFDFRNIPPVVKNLLIINVIFFVGTELLMTQGIDMNEYLGLHYWKSAGFYPHQLITYMFMHGGIAHIFFNMFALWMFGRILEQVWGPKRFLIYYMITGVGAGIAQLVVTHFRLMSLYDTLTPDAVNFAIKHGYDLIQGGKGPVEYINNPNFVHVVMLINSTTIGASGAVFGILLAFGMLFPNTELMLLFPPIPIKAKWFVIGYGAIELFSGVANTSGDNVAHFAHLGGMLFGFVLLKYWKQDRNTFY